MWESPLYLYMKMLFVVDEAAIGLLQHSDSQLPVATDVG